MPSLFMCNFVIQLKQIKLTPLMPCVLHLLLSLSIQR